MIATWAQAKELGYCSNGLRDWFKERDVTFLEFVQNGVPVEWLRAQEDGMADKLADYVEGVQRG